jgi:NOL1/NOP2/fmu family ribosome biogenesis protein
MAGGEKGWTLVTLAGHPVGFGRQTGEYLKNDYPSGWRLT